MADPVKWSIYSLVHNSFLPPSIILLNTWIQKSIGIYLLMHLNYYAFLPVEKFFSVPDEKNKSYIKSFVFQGKKERII